MTTHALTRWFDGLSGGFLVTDTASRVVYANRAVEQRTGYAAAEIIGKKPGELWGGHMPRSFYAGLWQTIATEARPFVGKFQNQPKGQHRGWETLQIAPVKNVQGIIEYFVEVHPQVDSQEQEQAFHQEFLRVAGRWHREPTVWQRLLGLLESSECTAASNQLQAFRGDFAECIRAELVLPMEIGLSRRFEDAALIRSAQADLAAYAVLYEKYVGLIRHYFVRRLTSQQEAEDLTQEVFIRAFQALPQFRVTNASYYTYLLHVAHNRLVDSYRRASRVAVCSQEVLDERVDEVLKPNGETMETLLRSLTPTERAAMLLTYREGYKVREVAQELGKTENAVKLMLSRSRKKLRSVLA